MNWCGRTKTSTEASRAASAKSGQATTLSGRRTPAKYLGFSCAVLIHSVSLRPSHCYARVCKVFRGRVGMYRRPPMLAYNNAHARTISSNTHIRTSGANRWCRASTFRPSSRATADPKLPDPMMVTRCGAGGSSGWAEEVS